MNYKLVLMYDGSRYKGWQLQKNTDMTIQGKLQAVLTRLCGYEVEVHGSGRTDAGVHAKGQVANVKLKQPYDTERLHHDLNAYLPEDIAVLSVETVSERFHSRLSAVRKTYRYRLWTGSVVDVFERKYVTPVGRIPELANMRRAASYLEGTHDFTSFCGNRHFKKSAVRTIEEIRIAEQGDEVIIDVTGNGFLQNMMRILVGTLLEVGMGQRTPEEMITILEGKSRSLSGRMMPAKGLCLMSVEYEDKA